MVVKFTEVETDKLTANEYKKHLLVKYNDQPCFIQTNWMKLDHYGVPNKDKYHPTEESRRYVKVPLPLSDPDFTKFILKLDTYFSSDKFKSKCLTQKQSDFSYIPIYKQGGENYNPYIKIPRCQRDRTRIPSPTVPKKQQGIMSHSSRYSSH